MNFQLNAIILTNVIDPLNFNLSLSSAQSYIVEQFENADQMMNIGTDIIGQW